MAFSMIPMSLNHSVESATDTTCNLLLWLLVIGFGVTFSALFAKTLRINRIMASAMQCRRIKLSVRDTLYPVVIISFCKYRTAKVCDFVNIDLHRYH